MTRNKDLGDVEVSYIENEIKKFKATVKKPVSMMRHIIKIYILSIFYEPSEWRHRQKHIWRVKPACWPDYIAFRDPNNGKEKPRKKDLEQMVHYLLDLYEKNINSLPLPLTDDGMYKEFADSKVNVNTVEDNLSEDHDLSVHPENDIDDLIIFPQEILHPEKEKISLFAEHKSRIVDHIRLFYPNIPMLVQTVKLLEVVQSIEEIDDDEEKLEKIKQLENLLERGIENNLFINDLETKALQIAGNKEALACGEIVLRKAPESLQINSTINEKVMPGDLAYFDEVLKPELSQGNDVQEAPLLGVDNLLNLDTDLTLSDFNNTYELSDPKNIPVQWFDSEQEFIPNNDVTEEQSAQKGIESAASLPDPFINSGTSSSSYNTVDWDDLSLCFMLPEPS